MNHDLSHIHRRAELRASLIALRCAISRDRRDALDQLIRERLQQSAPLRSLVTAAAHRDSSSVSPVVGFYWPMRAEPDLRPLADTVRQSGIVTALPMMNSTAPSTGVVGQPPGGLRYARYDSSTALHRMRFGVMEPREEHPVLPDLIVAPCVGFVHGTAGLYRLGYGGGYYDRTLAWRPVPCIGVAYDECEVPGLELRDTDMPLAAVVTPTRVLLAQSV